MPTPGSSDSLAQSQVKIDTKSPLVQDVSSSKLDGTYKAGESIPIQVVFSEIVDVTGTPKLTLDLGSGKDISYVSGTNSNTLVFNYVVQAGDSSSDFGL